MNDALENAIQAALGSLTSIGSFGGFTPPTSYAEVLQLTVGDYLQLLTAAEQSLVTNQPIIQAQLNNPQFTQNLPPEALSFFQDWAAGNTDFITQGFDAVRAALNDVPANTLLVDVVPGAGGGGVITVSDEIEQAFTDAATRVGELGWTGGLTQAVSPTFSVDDVTGSWFSLGGDTPAFSGADIAALYALVGEAAGNAIIASLNQQSDLLQQLLDDGATANDFALATDAVEAAAAQAFESLQGFGATILGEDDPDLAQIEAQAYSQYLAVVNAVTDELPTLASTLEKLMFGSRNSDPTFVVDLNGTLQGSDEGDWVHLNDRDNSFNGGPKQDIVFAYGGNDILQGGGDDDVLLGGPGSGDTAVYTGVQTGYTVEIGDDGAVQIVDRTADRDGRDTVTGIETLQFGDNTTFDLGTQLGIATLSEDEIASFIELYIAYFNRAPDAIGVNFWGSAFANGFSLEAIAGLFIDQPETRATYPDSATNLQFATSVYENVLGRTPDTGGLTFWAGALDGGGVTRDQFNLQVLQGVRADAPVDATQEEIDLRLGDRDYLEQKTDIGAYYAIIKGLSNVQQAGTTMGLFERGDAASVQSAVQAIDAVESQLNVAEGGELIVKLVGIIDDPFAGPSEMVV